MTWGDPVAGALTWGDGAAPVTPSAMAAILAGEAAILVEITRRTLVTIGIRRAGWGDYAWGDTVWGGGAPTIAYGGATSVLRYADRHFISGGADLPPWTEWDGRVVAATVQRAVRLSPDQIGDDVHSATVDLTDPDQAVADALDAAAIDGRPARLLIGPRSGPYARFVPVWVGLADAGSGRREVTSVTMTDATWHLDDPVQPRRYAGTGGVQGGPEVAGRLKPLAFGVVRNVEGVPVDPAGEIEHWHDGRLLAVDAVYDQGLALPLDGAVGDGGDVPDYDALVAASVAYGHYATCLAEGLTKRGSPAAGVVTADLRGDVVDGAYVDAIPAIGLRLLVRRSSLPATHLHALSFERLALDVPHAGGIYLTQEESARSVLGRLLTGIGCAWSIDRRGRVFAHAWSVPQERDAVLSIDETDILAIDPDPLPPPVWRRVVTYAANHRVQTGPDVADVSPERRAWLAQPHRLLPREQPAVREQHARAREPAVLDTHLRDLAGAAAVAVRLEAAFGTARGLWRADVPASVGAMIDPGVTVIARHPIAGLAAGKAVQAWPVRHDLIRQRVTLLLWG